MVLRQVNLPCALIGWALSLPVYIGLALRWQVFLRQQEITLPLQTVFSLTWAGQFFNSFLPGSTGGDFVKIFQLCRLEPERKAVAAATVIADRVVALLALMVLAGVACLIEPAPLHLLSGVALSVKLILASLVVVVIGSFILIRLLKTARWIGLLMKVIQACREALTFSSRVVIAFLLGLGVHLLNFSVIYFFARSLGLSITYLQVQLMMPVVLLFLLLPVTINGHGLREVLLIGYLSYFGVHLSGHSAVEFREMAVALSLLIVGNDLCWSLPGGLWYFYRFGRAPAKRAT